MNVQVVHREAANRVALYDAYDRAAGRETPADVSLLEVLRSAASSLRSGIARIGTDPFDSGVECLGDALVMLQQAIKIESGRTNRTNHHE